MATENGAPSLATTSDDRLNLFFKTVRNLEDDALYDLLQKSWTVHPLDTIKILYNWRDCRGGKGDHRGFIVAMAYIEKVYPEWFFKNFRLIPEYGSWLDLVKLWHVVSSDAKKQIMNYIVETLEIDIESENVSLLAKWLPSENSKWDRYTEDRFILSLCKTLFDIEKVTGDHIKMLRKHYLVPLRAKINIVETKMCKKSYEEIQYEHVPSVAMNRYKNAFRRNDFDRFNEYMKQVTSGKTKINASQVYPHDLVRQYMNGQEEDPVIEAQWKEIKAKTKAFENSIVVCDVSGSMEGTPMEVAIALGLLGLCDNKLITFSESPKLHDVPNGSLYEQINSVSNMQWGGNTDFEKVIDLVFDMICRGHEIKKIFVFSDMQFDMAFKNAEKTHFEMMRVLFEESNIPLPTIIFWNLRADTNDFPVTSNENGVILLSGYSPSLLKSLLDDEEITPLNMMFHIIHSERYDAITSP